jgi:hypothetical protein
MRRPPKILAFMLMAIGGSLLAMALVAKAVLFLYPPTDLDRACLAKPMTEVNKCVYKYREAK